MAKPRKNHWVWRFKPHISDAALQRIIDAAGGISPIDERHARQKLGVGFQEGIKYALSLTVRRAMWTDNVEPRISAIREIRAAAINLQLALGDIRDLDIRIERVDPAIELENFAERLDDEESRARFDRGEMHEVLRCLENCADLYLAAYEGFELTQPNQRRALTFDALLYELKNLYTAITNMPWKAGFSAGEFRAPSGGAFVATVLREYDFPPLDPEALNKRLQRAKKRTHPNKTVGGSVPRSLRGEFPILFASGTSAAKDEEESNDGDEES